MRNLDGRSKLYALFASPCEHSLSPLIQNSAFEQLNINAAYMAFDVDEEHIGEAVSSMRTLGIAGANISMPNKTAIIEYLNYVSEEARFCNAVNTVVNKEGILYGYNTDIFGAEMAIKDLGVDVSTSKVCILGLGGAGQAVLYALARNNVKKVSVFVRKQSMETRKAYIDKIRNSFNIDVKIYIAEDKALLSKLVNEADLLINATKLGMGQDIDKNPLDDKIKLPKHICILDLIYNPGETKLLERAKREACTKYSNGLPMLVYQGVKAFEHFTEKQIDISYIFTRLENAFKI